MLEKTPKKERKMKREMRTANERPRGQGTYNVKEILAYVPEYKAYMLMKKVPYTKQTYETQHPGNLCHTMDWLIEAAKQHNCYLPIVHPTFVKTKYRFLREQTKEQNSN